MTLHLTAEQAAALGLVDRKPGRQTRKAMKLPHWSRCVACDTVFTTTVSEDRHVKETGHARYESLPGQENP